MRRSRITIAAVGLGAAAAVGGVTAAAVTTSPAGHSPPAAYGAPAHQPAAGPAIEGTATVRTAQATVGGRTETILVNAQGLPLYYYRPDTATRSLVAGSLAGLWPALTSKAPTAAELPGRLTTVADAHGSQVAFNGHLLYTFTSDTAGAGTPQVTGQGVENFFVATAGLAPLTSSSIPANTMPTTMPTDGYGGW
jgi:predicted lipoprotein with Yx(FWY)xxD motif